VERIPSSGGEVIIPGPPFAPAYYEFGYAPARRVGDTLYVSGVIIFRAEGEGNDAAAFEAQVRRGFRTLEMTLKAAGATFADVAMDYSEDAESARRGGDLGLVPVSALKQAAEPLRQAVLGQKPGTVTVATAGGIHTIVAVIAHEQAGERGLSTPAVNDGITQTLKERKEQLLRTAYLSAARGDAAVVNHAARRVVQSQGKLQ
jgi:parvulin-like peptidyl-prolyl isomerase